MKAWKDLGYSEVLWRQQWTRKINLEDNFDDLTQTCQKCKCYLINEWWHIHRDHQSVYDDISFQIKRWNSIMYDCKCLWRSGQWSSIICQKWNAMCTIYVRCKIIANFQWEDLDFCLHMLLYHEATRGMKTKWEICKHGHLINIIYYFFFKCSYYLGLRLKSPEYTRVHSTLHNTELQCITCIIKDSRWLYCTSCILAI